jgi:hypothetical protein
VQVLIHAPNDEKRNIDKSFPIIIEGSTTSIQEVILDKTRGFYD